jgi:hypothetical protein
MKKTFKLHVEGKNSDRLLESIKHQVRKYVKRERRKILPAGVDYWDFDCKFGVTEAVAQEVHLAEIIKKMDEVSRAGGDGFYVEILAAHGVRQKRPAFTESPDY